MSCLLCHKPLAFRPLFSQLLISADRSDFLCHDCQATFIKIKNHCPRCYKPGPSDLCQDCKNWEAQGVIIEHTALYHYNSAMKAFFSQYKFMGDYRLGQVFQSDFRQLPKDRVLVPIPVSSARMQERGFNQVSHLLGKLPFQELLTKTDSLKQSSLSRTERLKTSNPFQLVRTDKLPDKILLVDDIYTTGATLVHASQIFKAAGVKSVQTFSLCR
ncbi:MULTISPECIES: ComF family protein [unclassified Lactococcus]|uniref:ComF family protein n=1 Tax=unclassified Lactococcus TaxID=2643510 RepID=UPI0011CCB1F1|nr:MULTISPECIES: ComF family protein [unclassified Lactococcus]MQW23122.1 ComF family protein [Lactococcus sp. dk101]TXK44176.1 ComF family protein [Lactococcus sp. dk310]TXK49907.1 ComF family protein [Lactococcus sp. dk322]